MRGTHRPRTIPARRQVSGPVLGVGLAGVIAAGVSLLLGLSPVVAALTGVGVAVLLPQRTRDADAVLRLDEVERHIARCRRTSTSADLVVAAYTDPATARACADRLRISDDVRVVGAELHAVLDRGELDRKGFEARLSSFAPADYGWARFPEDAPTVAELVTVGECRAAIRAEAPAPALRGPAPTRRREPAALPASSGRGTWRVRR